MARLNHIFETIPYRFITQTGYFRDYGDGFRLKTLHYLHYVLILMVIYLGNNRCHIYTDCLLLEIYNHEESRALIAHYKGSDSKAKRIMQCNTVPFYFSKIILV